MKIKIMFLIPTLNGGGAERVVCNLINRLNKNIFNVSLFLFKKEGVYWDILSKDINIYVANKNKSASKVKILKELYKATKDKDIVISAMELFPTYCVTLISKLLKKKCIGWVHINIDSILNDKKIYIKLLHKYILIRLFYNKLDKIITVSNGAKKNIEKYLLKTNRNRCICIYNPIDIKYIRKKSQEKIDMNITHPIIMGIGRLEKQKNFQLLIKAHKLLLERNINNNLVILGQGSQEMYLKSLIQKLSVEKSVIFLGFQENPYKYLKQADIFVQSSIYEGLPTVLIEALVLNIPVVATNCPDGAKEILENGKYGLLVKMNDEKALADAIEKILLDREIREKYKIKNKEAISRFDDKYITCIFEKLFLQVIEQK